MGNPFVAAAAQRHTLDPQIRPENRAGGPAGALTIVYSHDILKARWRDLIRPIARFRLGQGELRQKLVEASVTPFECEQVFFNQPLVVVPDKSHSEKEVRFYVLGQSDIGRLLFMVFTIRKNLIRVISARDMTRSEKGVYTSHEK